MLIHFQGPSAAVSRLATTLEGEGHRLASQKREIGDFYGEVSFSYINKEVTALNTIYIYRKILHVYIYIYIFMYIYICIYTLYA
jgi:hypothetical protein